MSHGKLSRMCFYVGKGTSSMINWVCSIKHRRNTHICIYATHPLCQQTIKLIQKDDTHKFLRYIETSNKDTYEMYVEYLVILVSLSLFTLLHDRGFYIYIHIVVWLLSSYTCKITLQWKSFAIPRKKNTTKKKKK